jgi:hypothetical protein
MKIFSIKANLFLLIKKKVKQIFNFVLVKWLLYSYQVVNGCIVLIFFFLVLTFVFVLNKAFLFPIQLMF